MIPSLILRPLCPQVERGCAETPSLLIADDWTADDTQDSVLLILRPLFQSRPCVTICLT